MLIFGCLLLSAHAQYLNNIITVRYAQVGMEFFRNKFGVQYMLDAIRQFYRYVIHVIYGLYPFMVLGLCRFCFCYNTIRCISLGCKALIEKK